jgi:gliding motility-associated-like protein
VFLWISFGMYRAPLIFILLSFFIFGFSFKKKPKIVGQHEVATSEDKPRQITASDLIIEYEGDGEETPTVEVFEGPHYAVDGSTVVPETDFNGTLTVPVRVDNGEETSNKYDLQMAVTAENDPPVITGQSSLSTKEGKPLTIKLQDLQVSDPDNDYPRDFTLTVYPGSNYTLNENTITPASNFSGTLSVPVTVNDGTTDSNPYNLQIEVANVNDAPVITGQQSLSTNEDTSIDFQFSFLNVTDNDNSYPSGFSFTLFNGQNYSVNGGTITPDQDFNGVLSVGVSVNDGTDNSNVYTMAITVQPVNDAPVITGQTNITSQEDTPFTISFQNLQVRDPDNNYPDNFSITVFAGENYTVSGNTVTPASNFSGTLNIPVSVNDGAAQSNTYTLQAEIKNQNDPPVITGQLPKSTSEEQPVSITLADLSVQDTDDQYPTGFSLKISGGENYSVSGNTVNPANNFSGTLHVPVTVNDGKDDSAPFDFQITVQSVDDSPVITGQSPFTIHEDESGAIQFSNLQVTDNDSPYPSGFSMTLYDGENYTHTDNVVTPAPNFNGTLHVLVTVNDGSNISNTFNFVIDVQPVNDAPVITGQKPVVTEEDKPVDISFAMLEVTDPDNNYPSGFSINVQPGTNYSVSGTTITPAIDFNGILSVPVTVSDGAAESWPFNLQITVGNDNDPPVITGQQNAQTNEEQPFTLDFSYLTVSDPDNTYPQGFSISVSPGQNYSVTNNAIQPAKDFNGTLSIPITVNDGSSNSNVFAFQLSVLPVNDKPVVQGQTRDLTTYKNTSIEINLSDLRVADVDNNYPDGFSLSILPGDNYTSFQNTVTPNNDFVGILSVLVVVSDGTDVSEPFTLKLSVVKPPNVVPVIKSQTALTTYENQALQLSLSQLVVQDPDNNYPDDFTLKVYNGQNYVVNHTVVIPEKDFSGTLSVPVTVSDKESTSNIFDLKIQVLPVSDVPLITSQKFLEIQEDDSLTLQLTDLIVIDPDNHYPDGFTLSAQPGEHYGINGLQIKPAKDFNGYLSVPVTVNDGTNVSATYQLLIFVNAVNDAPTLSEETLLQAYYNEDIDSFTPFEKVLVNDVDDDTLSLAQVAIPADSFEPGRDSLFVSNTEAIKAVFDNTSGLLVIFGKASVAAYQDFIRSINYHHKGNLTSSKTVILSVSDGKTSSADFSKMIGFGELQADLDIPGGFTPNGDGANDTWSVRVNTSSQFYENAIIRVYNRGGAVVFEATGLQAEWDGRMNGVALPADSYFYTIDLRASHTRNRYQGVVTILR